MPSRTTWKSLNWGHHVQLQDRPAKAPGLRAVLGAEDSQAGAVRIRERLQSALRTPRPNAGLSSPLAGTRTCTL